MKNRVIKMVLHLLSERFLTATPSSNLEKIKHGVTSIITIGG